MTRRDFDAAAVTWDQNQTRQKLAEELLAAIQARVVFRGHELLLDFGTGTGALALGLAPRVKRVLAVDSSPGMLEVLSEKIRGSGLFQIEPCLWDLTLDPEPPRDCSSDIIVSAMALHHIADTAAFARSMWRLLVPGGRLALCDLFAEDGSFHGDNTGVEHFGFEPEELLQVFGAVGFEELRIETATTVVRSRPEGERAYPVFLLLASRPNA